MGIQCIYIFIINIIFINIRSIINNQNDTLAFLFGGCDRDGNQFNDMHILSISIIYFVVYSFI